MTTVFSDGWVEQASCIHARPSEIEPLVSTSRMNRSGWCSSINFSAFAGSVVLPTGVMHIFSSICSIASSQIGCWSRRTAVCPSLLCTGTPAFRVPHNNM